MLLAALHSLGHDVAPHGVTLLKIIQFFDGDQSISQSISQSKLKPTYCRISVFTPKLDNIFVFLTLLFLFKIGGREQRRPLRRSLRVPSDSAEQKVLGVGLTHRVQGH